MQNRYVLSILVQNHYGVLRRISSLFSRRGYSIESLSSGDAEKPELSRVTVVARGDEDIIDQIKKQVSKLVEVVGVTIFEDDKAVYRELMLIKVKTTRSTRAEIMEITDIFRAHIVDVAPSSLVLEVTGDSKKLSALIGMLEPFGIMEIVRTGLAGIKRGDKSFPSKQDE